MYHILHSKTTSLMSNTVEAKKMLKREIEVVHLKPQKKEDRESGIKKKMIKKKMMIKLLS